VLVAVCEMQVYRKLIFFQMVSKVGSVAVNMRAKKTDKCLHFFACISEFGRYDTYLY